MDALELNGVCKTFGQVRAVDNLAAKIPAGSIYGFLGPNGAGKTTTLRMIMNIIRPDTGSISVFGNNLTEKTKSHIGYMPEERGLYRKMTVSGILCFFGALKGLTAKELADVVPSWLKRIELFDRANKKVEDLSRGMHQKLQFAATVINEPDLLILDEPFSGLDPLNLDLLKTIILEMKEKGKTVIFSTHDMHGAETLCDYILLINKGKIVLDGKLNDIRSQRATNAVIVEAQGDTSFLKTLPIVTNISQQKDVLEITLAKGADTQELLKILAGKLRVRKFEVKMPSLHEIFVTLVGETMRKIYEIARREYIDTVKTKTFLFSLLFTPILIVGIAFFTSRINNVEGGRPPVKVAVTDLTGQLASEIEAAINKHNKSNPKRQILFESLPADDDVNAVEEQGRQQLRSGRAEAYVVIDPNIIDGAGSTNVYTYKSKPTMMDATWAVEGFIRNAVVAQRCKVQNVSQKLLDDIRNVNIEQVEIGETASEQHVQSQGQNTVKMMIPFFFMFMIYMGIIGIGQQMLSSVIEEKNSRIIEMLLSAVSPFELMAGKILGLGAIGLTIIALWTGVSYGPILWQHINVDITGKLMFCFVLYYILGFLLFSALLAAIGSVCNTLKETQEFMRPVVLILIFPMIAWFKLVQSPDGVFARVLSIVPPISPLVMPLRISAGSNVGNFEIFASIALLVGSVIFMMWFAGRIFRIGILMYGKRPTLREIARWLRAS